MRFGLVLVAVLTAEYGCCQADLTPQLVSIKRVYVDKLTGGDAADQMRDLIIAALHASRLYVITENAERADATLRGAADDLVFTDTYSSADGVRIGGTVSSGRPNRNSTGRYASVSAGENESSSVHERKHEAMATVRLVNKDGDVIWSTTQESTGAKFRGASADVADRIAKQLVVDYERVKKGPR